MQVGDKIHVGSWNKSINGYYYYNLDDNTTIHSKTNVNPAIIKQIKRQELSSGRTIIDLYTY